MYESSRRLYKILQVRSVDVDFYWDTEMLMGMILREVALAESDEELRQGILYKHYGQVVWAKMESHLDEIKSLLLLDD